MTSLYIKSSQLFLISLFIFLGVFMLSTKTVFAGTFTCNDGTTESLPNAEDNLTARQEVCSDNGGFGSPTAGNGPCDLDSSFLGLPTWYKYLDAEIDTSGRCSPVLSGSDTEGRVNSALPIGLAVLEAMLRLAGMVAVVMMFVAGFRFITSDGSPEKAAGARKTIINAIIGLAIVVLSTGLVAFIGSTLSK